MEQYKDIPEWVTADERRKTEISNDIGLFDKNQAAVFYAMIDYSTKYHTAYLPMQGLYKHIYDYGLRNNNNALKVQETIVTLLKQVYAALYRKRYCGVDSQDNKVAALILQDPRSLTKEQIDSMIAKLKKEYYAMDESADRPFPVADQLPKAGLSPRMINIVSLKDMTNQKIQELSQGGPITKILLPSNLDIIVPTEELPSLYSRAYNKIRQFLQRYRDFSSLIMMKMKNQYPNLVGLNNPEDLLSNERGPQFTVALVTEVLNNIQNTEKVRSLQQAAFIVKQMAIQQSEQMQRQTHDDKSMEILLKIMETYPVPFSKKQILLLREKHSYLKLYTERDYIDLANNFVEVFSKSQKPETPPMIVEISDKGDKKYIHRKHFYNNFINKVDSIGFAISKEFNDQMENNLAMFINSPFLKDMVAFDEYLEDFIRKHDDGSLSILEKPEALYPLLNDAARRDTGVRTQISRFYYPSDGLTPIPRRKSLNEILGLDLNKIVREAKARMPSGFHFSLIDFILGLFRGFGSTMGRAVENQIVEKKKLNDATQEMMKQQSLKKQKEEKAKKDSQKQSQEKQSPENKAAEEKKLALKKQLEQFKNELTGRSDFKTALSTLEARWNRSLSKDAKEQNVLLVKEKMQHRLKFMKLHSVESIKTEVSNIMKMEEVLKKVHDREAIRDYMALYMSEYFIQRMNKSKS